MHGKKNTHLPGIRVPEELAKQYQMALEFYGPSHAGFMRSVIRGFIKHAEGRDHVLAPLSLRIERSIECPHCHHQFRNVDAEKPAKTGK